jgi:hypothetical protein
VVSFGTEHNTTAMRPLTVDCRDAVPLDPSLMNISFKGAACVAAHQYLVSRGHDPAGLSKENMEQLGQAIFYHYFNV